MGSDSHCVLAFRFTHDSREAVPNFSSVWSVSALGSLVGKESELDIPNCALSTHSADIFLPCGR